MSAAPPARRRFAVDAVLIGASRTVPVLVPLLFTPFVLASFGRELYSLWAVLVTLIGILQNADLGITAVMQRFHSHHRGAADDEASRRLTGTVLLVVLAVAIVLAALGPLVASGLLALLALPQPLAGRAFLLLAPVGAFAGLQLIGLALTGYLAGHDRFLAAALASLGARAGLALVLGLTVTLGWGVEGLVLASAVDGVLAVALGLGAAWPHVRRSLGALLTRAERAEVWGFAWRAQLSTAGFLAQRESDVLLAVLLLPLASVGDVAAAAQSSVAVSLFPTILLVPLVTRIGFAAAKDRAAAIAVAARADAGWARAYPLYAGVVLGALAPAVAAWVGPALPLAPLLAVLIAAGMFAFLPGSVLILAARGLGSPGIEASAYLALVATKLVAGVAGALLFGPIGLAASTLLASVAAQIVLGIRGPRLDPALRLRRPPAATIGLATAAAAASAGGAFGAATLIAQPGPRLLVIGVWAALVLAATAAIARPGTAREDQPLGGGGGR